MKKNQKGLTLIEMMIAMVIGLLIVGTVITIFITNVRSNRDFVSMTRLNQELRGVMTFVSDELKKAGYSADPEKDDFVDELTLSGANCLRYGYDEDGDGSLDADERFGFQLNANAIEWANSNTDITGCSSPDWEDITDTNIAFITVFNLTPIPPVPIPAGTVDIYQMTVTITGTTELSGGTTATRTVSEVIRIRNDDA